MWRLYKQAIETNEEKLLQVTMDFMQSRASEILLHPAFYEQPTIILMDAFKRGAFTYAPEMDKFKAIRRYALRNPTANVEELARRTLTLSQFTEAELFEHVRPSFLFNAESILDALEVKFVEQSDQDQSLASFKTSTNQTSQPINQKHRSSTLYQPEVIAQSQRSY